MRRVLMLLVILIAVAMSAASCGGKQATTEKKAPAEKTAQTSVKVQSPGKTGERNPDVRSVDYADPQICGGCHTDIFAQWSGSMHSSSYPDPIYQKVLALANSEGKGEFDEFCTACHTPIGFEAGEVPPWLDSNLSAIAKKGVQCDFCHTVVKPTGVSNYQFTVDPGDIKRGPFKDAISPYHGTKYSEPHTQAEFCGMCHDVNHPRNGLALESTYAEWKKGPYAQKGIICQDCHMTPGPGVTKPNPGQAAVGGPKRKHIWTHYFVGGNTAVTSLMGSQEHARQAVERLQAAAALSIKTEPLKLNADNKMEIDVANIGCGHYLPTGLTETREMWLDVTVTDGTGRTIFRSGAIEPSGKIADGSVVYNTVFADKTGAPTHSVWFAEKLISDKRIPPKKSSKESFAFAVPADAVAPLNVDAILKYRSASQELIDKLFGPGQLAVPVVEMTRIQAEIR